MQYFIAAGTQVQIRSLMIDKGWRCHLTTQPLEFARFESASPDEFVFLWKNWLIRAPLISVEGNSE